MRSKPSLTLQGHPKLRVERALSDDARLAQTLPILTVVSFMNVPMNIGDGCFNSRLLSERCETMQFRLFVESLVGDEDL